MTELLRPVVRERPSEPRDRLLATGSRIFYADGIRHVGVERIIGEAGVTKATFYRHFPSKDDLVLAYLAAAHAAIAAGVEQVEAGAAGPADALRGIAAGIAADFERPEFRGCAFINAAAEYPDPESVVHRAVLEHRAWFLEVVTRLLSAAGVPKPKRAGRHVVMLRDGAMVAGYLAGREVAGDTLTKGVDGILATAAR